MAVSFPDSLTSRVDLPSPGAKTTHLTAWSLLYIFRADGAGFNRLPFDQHNNFDRHIEMQVRDTGDPTGRLWWQQRTGSSQAFIESGETFVDNAWYGALHVKRANDDYELHVGPLLGTLTSRDTDATSVTTFAQDPAVTIGNSSTSRNIANSQFRDGAMARVVTFARALTAAEAQEVLWDGLHLDDADIIGWWELETNTDTDDRSTVGNNGTVNGTVNTETHPPGIAAPGAGEPPPAETGLWMLVGGSKVPAQRHMKLPV